MNKAKDFTSFMKSNNSHFNKIMIKSHKKNSFKSDKNNSKIKEIHLYNIYKDMMLFKRKINRIKKIDLSSNNTKILKRKNLNNFFNLKEKLFNQNNKNESTLFKNDIKIKNINNSFNLYNFKNSINNINNNCSKSLLLTNFNKNKILLNQNKNIKTKENIISNIKTINKYNTNIINYFINFKELKSKTNKKRKIINDFKLANKTNISYIKNLIEKNKLLNIKTIKKNKSDLKYKINSFLITINNNNIIQKSKSPFSCRNNIKNNLTFKLE